MTHTRFWFSGAGLASCLVLAACQTQQQTAALECGAAGGGLAFAACKAMGHTDQQCLAAGGLIGGVAAAGCYGYAQKLDNERKALAGKEGDLDARIRYVHALNDASQQLNADLGKRVAAARQNTDQLVALVRQRQATADQIAQARKQRDDELRVAAAQAVKSSAALQDVKAYKAQYRPQSPTFDAGLARQEQLNNETQQLVAQLAAQKQRI